VLATVLRFRKNPRRGNRSNIGLPSEEKESTMFYSIERALIFFAIAIMLAMILSQAAQAAKPARGAAASAAASAASRTYAEERARCQSGVVEDKHACLREAGAALQEARAGKLADANTSFESNKVARCGYLTGDDKEYCLRRMNGEGTTSGSVEGGGVLRELTVEVPAPQ
jgi:hypothetical protein